MAFVILIVSCTFGTFIPETMFNDLGPFEAFYKAINSLPTNMLTSIMSTELTKWVIRISHFYILGGILMIQNFRNAIVRQYLRQLSGFELNGYVMNTEGCNPQKPYESSFELNEYVMNTTH